MGTELGVKSMLFIHIIDSDQGDRKQGFPEENSS